MKKFIKILSVFAFIFLFTACNKEILVPKQPVTKVIKSTDASGNTITQVVTVKNEVKEYSIYYELDGGNTSNPNRYKENEEIILSDASKEGYTFIGWFTTESYNKQVSKIEKGTKGNITLYAKFEPIKISYKINYVLDGGTTTNNKEFTGEKIILTDASKEGYEFAGWYKDSRFKEEVTEIVDLTEDITLYAKFETPTYTINYELNGGENNALNPKSYVSKKAYSLKDAVKSGYIFAGWYLDSSFSTKVTEIAKGSKGDITLYAKFDEYSGEKKTFNITYSIEYPGTHTNPSSISTDDGILTLQAASKQGYDFKGWYTSDSCRISERVTSINPFTLESDITLYPRFELTNYNITYVLNGGNNNGNNVESFTCNATIDLYDASKAGYTFAGWYTSNSFDEATKITQIEQSTYYGDIVLYAKYTPISYEISYNCPVGTVNPNNTKLTFTTEEEYVFLNPTLDGYTFKYWKQGNEIVTKISKGRTSNVNVEAVFEPTEYSITYVLNGGENNVKNPTSFNITSNALPLFDATMEGYGFDAWYTTETFDVDSKITEIPAGSIGNITLYAHFVESTYSTITYVLEDGVVNNIENKEKIYTNKEFTFKPASKKGYSFDGWYTTETFDVDSVITKLNVDDELTLTLYPKFSLSNYIINYNYGKLDSADITNLNGLSYTILDYGKELVGASKPHYTFVGWFKESYFHTPITKIEDVTGEITLYAKFEETVYTITYVNVDGWTNTNPTSYTYFTGAIVLSSPTKAGYSFLDWYKEDAFINDVYAIDSTIEESITLYAKYEERSFSVEYNLDGGSNNYLNPSEVGLTESFELKDPTKRGYEFKGWFTDELFQNQITSLNGSDGVDYVLFAKFEIITYKITYNLYGGTNSLSNPNGFNYYTNDIILADATKLGYTFIGWYTDKSFNEIYKITEIKKNSEKNYELYAKFEETIYTITYHLNNGTNSDQNIGLFNILSSDITLYDASRNGYTFDGWYTDSLFNNKIEVILSGTTNNFDLYAKFSAITYTITYVLNGGNNNASNPETYTADDVFAFAAAELEEHNFAGWYLDEECSDGKEILGVNNTFGNLILYAKFIEGGSNKITYVLNEGINSASNPASYSDGDEFIFDNPIRNGYEFIGWYTTDTFDSGTEITGIDSTDTGNIVVYACFVIGIYDIVYHNISEYDNPNTITEYSITTPTILLLNPSIEGYIFDGWYTDELFQNRITKIKLGSYGKLDLYPKLELITYNINYSFVYTNGVNTKYFTVTNPNPLTYTVQTTPFTLIDVDVEGYYVYDWYISLSKNGYYNSFNSSTQLPDAYASDIWLKCEYVARSYYIDLELDGGSNNNLDTGFYGEFDLTNLIADNKGKFTYYATKAGYTFTGWSIKFESDLEYSLLNQAYIDEHGSIVHANFTLLANYSKDTYTVTYILFDGVNDEENITTYNIDSATFTLFNPTKDGYLFGGWYLDSNFYEEITQILSHSTGNLILFAKWLEPEESFDISYVLDDGVNSLLNPNSYSSYDMEVYLYDATKEGYEFKGWFTDDTFINEILTIFGSSKKNYTLYAKFEVINYTISYNSNGGNLTSANPITYTIETESFEFKPYTKNGYEFIGFKNSTNNMVITGITKGHTGNLELTAVYELINYDVTYNLNDGNNSLSNIDSYSILSPTFTLYDAVKEGYLFEGWYSTGAFDGDAITTIAGGAVGAVELFAKFSPITYTITYELSDGTNGNNPSEYTIESESIVLDDATKDGFEFVGWYTEDSFINKVTEIASGSIGNVTLYARFIATGSRTVDYVLDGGTNDTDNIIEYTIGDTFTFKDATKLGYNFIGWYTTDTFDEGSLITEIITTESRNLVLFAKFEIVNYDITFEVEDGSAVNSITYNVLSDMDLPTSTSATSKEFVGWLTSGNKIITHIAPGSTGEMTLTAVFKNKYSIVFYSSDDESNEDVFYSTFAYEGDSLEAPTANPTKDTTAIYAYDFASWNNASSLTNIAGNIELRPIFEAKKILVFSYLSSNGGYYQVTKGEAIDRVSSIVIPDYYDDGIHGSLIVRNIASKGFMGCSNLESVTLPSNLVYVGEKAFSECLGLTTITIPGSANDIRDGAFLSCTNLENIIFEDGITNVANNFANSCQNLSSVTFPDSIKTIGNYSFYNCTSLKSLSGLGNITSIGSYAFQGCTNLESIDAGENVKTIYSYAFADCINLKAYNFAISLTDIYDNAFNNCKSLKYVTIPENVTYIGSYAFANCTGLLVVNYNATNYDSTSSNVARFYSIGTETSGTRFIIGDNVVRIPKYLLNGDSTYQADEKSNIVSLTLGRSLEYSYAYSFGYLRKLKEINYNCTNYKNYASNESSVSNCRFNSYTGSDAGCLAINIGVGVLSIPSQCFSALSETREINFETGCICKTIGESAFASHNGYLDSLVLPEKLEYIGDYAFYNVYDPNITELIIPDSVIEIGYCAFNKFSNVEKIVLGKNLKSVYYIIDESYNHKVKEVIIKSENIESFVFGGNIGMDYQYDDETKVTIILTDDVKNVIPGMFNYFYYINEVYLGNEIKAIENDMFANCPVLNKVVLGSKVEKIGQNAFLCCYNLTEIWLGNKIKQIDSYAFYFSDSNDFSIDVYYNGTPSDYAKIKYERPYEDTINRYVNNIYFKVDDTYEIIYDFVIDGTIEMDTLSFLSCIETVVINDATILPEDAFYLCCNLESVTINSNITEIGAYAFYDCASLSSFDFKDTITLIGEYAFAGTIIEEAILPEGLLEMDEGAFNECIALATVYIPSTLISIGERAFYKCSVETITFADGLKLLGEKMFEECCNIESVTIPNGIKEIPERAFAFCDSLVSVVLPSTLEVIGAGAFKYCFKLANINFPESLIVIDEYAFACAEGNEKRGSLTSITIPKNVTFIGDYAFASQNSATIYYNATEILEVLESPFYDCGNYDYGVVAYIGANVLSIPDGLFCNDYELINVIFAEGSLCTYIGSYAFYSTSLCLQFVEGEEMPISVDNLVLPSGVEELAECVFEGCYMIETIHLENIKLIDSYALSCYQLKNLYISNKLRITNENAFAETSIENIYFKGTPSEWFSINFNSYGGSPLSENTNLFVYDYDKEEYVPLDSIVIPEGTLAIADGEYRGMSSIENITLPSTLINIGEYAFAGMSKIKEITIPASVKSIGEGAFDGCTSLEKVYYLGTIEDWVSINFGDMSANPVFICYGNSAKNSYDDYGLYINDARLISIEIPSTVKKINDYSLAGLPITEAVFNEGITYIGAYTLAGSFVETVTIPSTVTSIGICAFCGISSLRTINYNAKNIASVIGMNIFVGSGDTTTDENGLVNPITVNIGSEVVVIPDSLFYQITTIGIVNFAEESVLTTIGVSSFNCCRYIESITLPNTVTLIDDYAFYACQKLTTFNMGTSKFVIGANAFINTNLTSVNLENATVIGNSAFANLGLIEINLTNCTSLGDYAFNGCYDISSIIGGENIITIGNYVFSGCLVENVAFNSVETIGNYAFYYCSKLVTASFTSVVSIGEYAFYGCSSLQSFAMGDNTSIIGGYAFSNLGSLETFTGSGDNLIICAGAFNYCTNLMSFDFTNVVYIYDGAFSSCTSLSGNVDLSNCITIGKNAFYNCTSIQTLTIGSDTTEVGDGAFRNCTGLVEVYYFSNVGYSSSYSYQPFYGAGSSSNDSTFYFGDETHIVTTVHHRFFDNGAHFKHVVIADGTTSIGNYAFYCYKDLQTITVGKDVESIGQYAFYQCTNLSEFIIQDDSLETLGQNAFYQCTNLLKVELGDAIREIPTYAFYQCSSMKVFGETNNLYKIGSNAFVGCSSLLSFTIPASFTNTNSSYLASGCFNNCTSLLEVINLSGTNITSAHESKIAKYALSIVTSAEDSTLRIVGNYTFMKDKAGKWAIVNYSGNASEVELPISVTIDEEVVSKFNIYDNAFMNHTEITKLTISQSVELICSKAFYGLTNLETLIIRTSGNVNHYIWGENNSGTITASSSWASNVTNALGMMGNNVTGGTTVIFGNNIEQLPYYVLGHYSDSTIQNQNITTVLFEENSICTAIPVNAFYYCTNLTSIVIPDCITSIGEGAFKNCNKLTSVTMPSSLESLGANAFENCKALTEFSIPTTISIIPKYAFKGCSKLSSITLPSSLESLGANAFEDCKALTEFSIPTTISVIPEYAFASSGLTSITIPDNITAINQYAFKGCSKLSSITLPSTVASLGGFVFQDCSALKSITIPSKIVTIPTYAFAGSGLTSITIPSTVTAIGTYAFSGCKSLETVVLSEGVTSIYDCAFQSCTKLTSITLPSTVTTLGQKAFYSCNDLTSITLSTSISTIPSYCFAYSGLTSITIPDNVKTIDTYAFEYCSSLTSIDLGHGVEQINSSAFYCLGELESIVIPASVAAINGDAFRYCNNLTTLYVESANIAAGFTDWNSCGYILSNVTVIYVEESISSLGSYLTGNYDEADTAIFNEKNYVVYTKKA